MDPGKYKYVPGARVLQFLFRRSALLGTALHGLTPWGYERNRVDSMFRFCASTLLSFSHFFPINQSRGVLVFHEGPRQCLLYNVFPNRDALTTGFLINRTDLVLSLSLFVSRNIDLIVFLSFCISVIITFTYFSHNTWD